jgi:hypothetical protein
MVPDNVSAFVDNRNATAFGNAIAGSMAPGPFRLTACLTMVRGENVASAVLRKEIQRVQHLGWATAPDELLIGLNARISADL